MLQFIAVSAPTVFFGENDVKMKVKYLAEKEHIAAVIGDVTAA